MLVGQSVCRPRRLDTTISLRVFRVMHRLGVGAILFGNLFSVIGHGASQTVVW
jgi:hypothetical protein